VYAEFVGERCGKLVVAEAGTVPEGLERASLGWLLGVLPSAGVLT
jgi:hypothetical protein